MPPILLDASLAGLVEIIVIIYLLVVILVEAAVMALLKLNPFGKCLLDSLIVNVVSLGAGYLISATGFSITMGGDSFLSLVVGFIVSVLVEGALLRVLNRKKPVKEVWKADVIMNSVTYFVMLIIVLIAAN